MYLFVVPHVATQTPLSKYGLSVGQLATHSVPAKYGLELEQASVQTLFSIY